MRKLLKDFTYEDFERYCRNRVCDGNWSFTTAYCLSNALSRRPHFIFHKKQKLEKWWEDNKASIINLEGHVYVDIDTGEVEDLTQKIEENKKLIEKYPFLKVYDWKDNFNYEVTWEDFLPEGWRKAMCPQIWEDLKELLIKAGALETFRFHDIKEKWGELRMGYNGLNDKYVKQLIQWEDKYLEMSKYSCIDCGEEVDYMRLNWISYYCKDCAVRLCNEQRKVGLEEVFIKVQDLKAFDKASKEDRKKYWISFTEEGEEYYVNKNN